MYDLNSCNALYCAMYHTVHVRYVTFITSLIINLLIPPLTQPSSRLISPNLCHLITVTLAGTAEHSPSSSTMRRKSTVITITRFLESAAIRYAVSFSNLSLSFLTSYQCRRPWITHSKLKTHKCTRFLIEFKKKMEDLFFRFFTLSFILCCYIVLIKGFSLLCLLVKVV